MEWDEIESPDGGKARKVPCPRIDFQDKTFSGPLSGAKAWEVCERVMNSKVKSKDSYMKLFTYPSGTASMQTIRNALDQLQGEGWIPDIVVIDYADNLSSMSRRPEPRDEINDTWMNMRALSQELHCLLITATQADAESFRSGWLDRKNFTGDRRKLDHVTAMIGINVTEDEKKFGVSRLNFVNIREGDSTVRAWIVGNLAVASPVIKGWV
jgi:hypothetical protein